MTGFEIPLAALAVASAATTAAVSIKQSQDQAKVDETIGKQKQTDAATATANAAFEEHNAQRRNALILARQQAIFAAAGIDPQSGSPVTIAIDSAKQARMEELAIRSEGSQQSQALTFESRIAKYRANVARGALPYQIAGGVLSTASAGVGTYYAARGRRSVLSDWAER